MTRASVIFIALIPLVFPSSTSTASQARARVTTNEAEYIFAESISFTLEAHSDTVIEDVVLRFTIGGDRSRNRRIPEFTPGTSILARHTDTLVRGQIPPAASITWWWALTDAHGAVWETEPRSFTYVDETFDWQTVDDRDIRVWWYDRDRTFADGIAGEARQVLSRLEGIIDPLPERRIQIVTYQSIGDMRPALVARGEVYEARLATLGARVAPDTLVLLAGPGNDQIPDILAHELSHIALHLNMAEDYVEAPLWLDEGLAMYVEGPLDEDEQDELDRAIASDELMSIRSLTSFPGQADLVSLAYAESRDVVAYLIESHGKTQLHRLLELIGTGEVTVDEALLEAYGYDQLALYEAYRAARGLGPAVPPDPTKVAANQRGRARRTEPPGGGICGSAVLVLPAFALWWHRRRQPG